jgi:integrase
MNVPPSFQRVKVEREEKNDFVVFEKEEFERLKQEVFYSRYFTQNRFDLSEREILIGRIMVFLCSTGLSYVDFDRLTIDNLFVDVDRLDSKKKYLTIKIHRQKTNIPEVCIIPIIDITIDLIIEMLGLSYQFYEGNDENIPIEIKLRILNKLIREIKKGKKFNKFQPRLFPKVLQQDFNKEIKLLMCKLGMVNEVKILKQVKNKVVDHNIPKYQLITSHTGRRTYITSCLRQGIRPHILMKTTGHKKIGTLIRYNKETELNIHNEFENKINTSGNQGVSK